MRHVMLRLLAIADRRAPDFVVGGQDAPYLRRWWVIPRNRVFNIYLHQFLRSDDDRALHDHPWLFNISWLLRGEYLEIVPRGEVYRKEGAFAFRWGASPHRVALFDRVPFVPEEGSAPVWTLFITGPRIREWGFLCPNGWRHWTVFTDKRDKGAIGRGCD